MSETLSRMAQKIRSAQELHQVVRTMKTLAAVNIPIYERAVTTLAEYEQTVESGFVATFHDPSVTIQSNSHGSTETNPTAAIVFGSDQGLVGDFNENLANLFAQRTAQRLSKMTVWPVGDRMFDELTRRNIPVQVARRVPDSVHGITRVISDLIISIQTILKTDQLNISIFHNRPVQNRYYESSESTLLPLDQTWLKQLRFRKWPTRVIPQIFSPPEQTWAALVREHLFVHLFRACAESLASENLSRLAAMQRAEKNIRELLDQFQSQFNQQRQASIDDELFDVVVGARAATRGPGRQNRATF